MDELQTSSICPEPSAVSAATAAFPKRKNRANMRKKDTEEGEDQFEDQSNVVRKAKQARGDPLSFTTRTDRAEDLSGVQYQGSHTLQAGADTKATAMLETETETDRDARSVFIIMHLYKTMVIYHLLNYRYHACAAFLPKSSSRKGTQAGGNRNGG